MYHHKLIIVTIEPTLNAASLETGLWVDALLGQEAHAALHSGKTRDGITLQPHATLVTPVYDSFDKATRNDVGTIIAVFSLDTFLTKSLPRGVRGIYLVVENTCQQAFTYRLDDNTVRSRRIQKDGGWDRLGVVFAWLFFSTLI